MMVSRFIPVIAIATLIVTAAPAAENEDFLIRTAGDLADLCSARSNDRDGVAAIHMCEGYIVGANQLHAAMMTNSKSEGLYCLPARGVPSRDQIAAEFVNWVRNSPQAAKLPAIEGFMRWAAARFPCS